MVFTDSDHYGCEKCGYAVRINTLEEYEYHNKEHSKKCGYELVRADGDCIRTAFEIAKEKKGLFCFANAVRKGGFKFLHSWCEVRGYIKKDSAGNFFVETKDIAGKELNDFVIDFSNNKKMIMQKDDFYKYMGITENDVFKFNSKEAKIQMQRSERKKGNAYMWIVNKLK